MPERFQVNLRGIIDLLANHLYSSPQVFVRELLQNAVDAIKARRELEPAHPGKVRFEFVDADPPSLIVEDDGVGLTEAEMHEFLSTIGASSKRGDLDRRRGDFIGQFGIGILSCFMVCDEIVVLSQSVRPGAGSLEWRGCADGTYALRPTSERLTPGTRVCLRLRPSEDEDWSAQRIVSLLRHYGEMLPVSIEAVSTRRVDAINRTPPWMLARRDDEEELAAYARDAFRIDPIDAIPLDDDSSGIRGVAFILPTPASPGDRGQNRIYLKGMFLTEDGDGILPEWAFFVRCVLNAESLRPTASREGFYQDRALRRAGEAIGRRLRAYLVTLAKRDRPRLERILATHDLAIRSLAVHDDEFFDLIIDLLTFETTLGRLPFGQYRRDNLELRVAPTVDQFRQIAPVAAAQSLCVFNGGYTYDEELLAKAAARFDGLTFERVTGADLIETLGEATDAESEAAFEFLRLADDALRPWGVSADLRRFAPADLPAMYGADESAGFRRSLEMTAENVDQHWAGVLDNLRAYAASSPPVRLCFNLANPLVTSLVSHRDERVQRTLTEVLYVQALLLGRHPLGGRELGLLNHGLSRLAELALRPQPAAEETGA